MQQNKGNRARCVAQKGRKKNVLADSLEMEDLAKRLGKGNSGRPAPDLRIGCAKVESAVLECTEGLKHVQSSRPPLPEIKRLWEFSRKNKT